MRKGTRLAHIETMNYVLIVNKKLDIAGEHRRQIVSDRILKVISETWARRPPTKDGDNASPTDCTNIYLTPRTLAEGGAARDKWNDRRTAASFRAWKFDINTASAAHHHLL